MNSQKFIPLDNFIEYPIEEMIQRSERLYYEMKQRRTVRDFSNKSVPVEIINNCILAAGTAPSGANQQPWHFVVITNNEIKHKIRIAAEEEEKKFYKSDSTKEWRDALAPLGVNENKPFLETAPVLIAMFEKKYGLKDERTKVKHYHTTKSIGIAAGMLITALHLSGLVTLTHTPIPMNFLNKILNRPANEKPFLILVTGYPAANATVPNLTKKTLDDIVTYI